MIADAQDLAVAAVQFASRPGAPADNLARALELASDAAVRGARLVVLPECCLSGYELARHDLADASMSIPGPASEAFGDLARRHQVAFVVGLLERDGDRFYNSAILCRPDGLVARYRKTHLPAMGLDRFCTPGDLPYEPAPTPVGQVGVLICYDFRFPEPARVLALGGAEVIALPTCWPETATDYPAFLDRTRAVENRVFVVAADHCGSERGTTFLGQSQVVAPNGVVLAEAGTDEAILIVKLPPRERAAAIPIAGAPEGAHGLLAGRRPELYGAITDHHAHGAQR